uniref:Ig-like domain-containing protein n=1 Tax=Leptobrachium leishanense TaxID=445787 RepID=A0A8C5Q9N8_9ANUR
SADPAPSVYVAYHFVAELLSFPNTSTKDLRHGYKHTIICNVFGFYPSGIEVKWFRNEQEQTTQVGYSGPHSDGDWTFQLLVSLETDIERGDVFTCKVQHVSLKDPLRVHWSKSYPDKPYSAKIKMAVGIVGFILGGLFISLGLLLFYRRCLTGICILYTTLLRL